jgi:predicted acetyltransferase
MELGPVTGAKFDEFSRAVMRAFHRELSDVDRERYERIGEPERTLAWFDEGCIVATTGAFTRELTVPGAVIPCAAVTAVTVVPTHRRRGLLTAMMRRQLEDLHERGDPVAILWASEGSIYGRFGYGAGACAARLVARRPAATLKSALPARSLRAGPAGGHIKAMRVVFERVRAQRPGMLDRPGPWWGERLRDPESERDGAQPLQAAIVEDGYALYAVRPDFDDTGPAGEVRVRELVAATPGAHAQLWAFLIDQDLTRTITWELAPVDEPLWLALTDPRAVHVSVSDGLWTRLVDVAAALAARRYAGDPDVVIEVEDDFCAWNTGRFRLSADGCERTQGAADLALDVASLGAAYLGGVTLRSLAAAGRVRELTPGAVPRASAAFRGDVEPWCPEIF